MISLILPSRGRPTQLFNAIWAAIMTCDSPELLEVVVVVDTDDQTMQDWYGPQGSKLVRAEPGIGMGKLNNLGAEAANGKYLLAMNDDCIIKTKSWDTRIRQEVAKWGDGIGLFWPNDTIFEERLSCFFGLSRKTYELLGEFGPRELMKYSIDPYVYTTFLELKAAGHNRMSYMADVIFDHQNKQEVAPGVWDYAGGNKELQDEDDARYAQLWPRLRRNVEKLKRVIEEGM